MGRVHVLGGLNVDHSLRLARHPAIGETVRGEVLPITPGGKGLNQAVAAALAGTVQDVQVELHGSVGDDEPGHWLIEVAGRHAVGSANVTWHDSHPTGTAWIAFAPGGANTVIVDPGANQLARWNRDTVLSTTDVVVAQLEVPPAIVSELLAAAKAAGARSILNPSPAGGSPELAAAASIVVVNEHELGELSGVRGRVATPSSPAEAGRIAADGRGADQTVVVTLGAAGAVAATPEGIIVAPGICTRAIDTTGAGDCFLGVLAASLAAGLELGKSMHRANRAAALSVERQGAVTSMPLAAEIDR